MSSAFSFLLVQVRVQRKFINFFRVYKKSNYLEHVQMKINSGFLEISSSSNSSSQPRIFASSSLSSSSLFRLFSSSSLAKRSSFFELAALLSSICKTV